MRPQRIGRRIRAHQQAEGAILADHDGKIATLG